MCIITEATSFRSFAYAIMDYAGCEAVGQCKPLYEGLRSFADEKLIKLDSPITVNSYTEADLLSGFNLYLEIQKEDNEKREQDIKENIDELQYLVKSYRSTAEFKKLLDFVGRFHYLSPYNAMMVALQNEGAQFVFTGRKWKEYGRMPKPNAQKLITLIPFGPIQCMFDYEDTEQIPGAKVVDATQLMNEWYGTLNKTSGYVSSKIMDTLLRNLEQYGIFLDDTMDVANTYGGYLQKYTDKEVVVQLDKDSWHRMKSAFLISVNKRLDKVATFHTICHELGHLFCRHLFYDEKKRRHLSLKEREFEAETVAWLVCKRRGIYNPSEEYLAIYAPDGEIPFCSTDYIMKAVTEIEKMLDKEIKIKDSLWYREDKKTKDALTLIINEIRERKSLIQDLIKY